MNKTVDLFIDNIKKHSGIIIIGANDGLEIEKLLKNNFKPLLLFEPLTKPFSRLLKNIKKNCNAFQYALGDYNGYGYMYVASNNEESSSLLKPQKHIDLYPEVEFYNTLELVDIIELDTFFKNFKELNPDNYKYIYMDVQGYELKVLNGAQNILKNIDAILTETNFTELYENCSKLFELDVFLQKFGFFRKTMHIRKYNCYCDVLYIKK